MKRILIFLIMYSCWQLLPVRADVLVPLNLFAEKNKDATKEQVFVWNEEKYSCDSPSTLYFKTEKEAKKLCALCPNREVKRMKGGDEFGYLKINGRTYYSCENEHCLKCGDDGRCGGDLGYEEIRDVYACVSKTIKKCPPDKPQLDTFGFCHSCDEENEIDMSWDAGDVVYGGSREKTVMSKGGNVCKNRVLISVGWSQPDTYSVLINCPMERPLQDYKGGCHSCDDTNAVVVASGRGLGEEKKYIIGSSGGNPWQGKQNAFCPNRIDIISGDYRGFYTVHDVLKRCPLDMPLRDEEGGCHSCDEPEEIIQNEAVAFWGNINYGKVYDADSNMIGKVVEVTPLESKKNKQTDRGEVKDMGGTVVGAVIFLDDTKRDSEYVWNMYDIQDKQIGSVKVKYNEIWSSGEGSFSGQIYDMEGNLVASGGGHYSGDNAQNSTSLYYWKNVSDKTCPNREMYRKNTRYRENVLFSRLKK